MGHLAQQDREHRASAHYGGNQLARDTDAAGYDRSGDFLCRICVSCLRQELTDYDGLRAGLRGRIGRAKGIAAVRSMAYQAIARASPHLAPENACQLRQRESPPPMRMNVAGSRSQPLGSQQNVIDIAAHRGTYSAATHARDPCRTDDGCGQHRRMTDSECRL